MRAKAVSPPNARGTAAEIWALYIRANMKQHVLLLPASVATFIACGQGYPPLLDNSLWSVHVTTIIGGTSDYWLQYELDTTINATVYQKYVRSSGGGDPDIVREDVANKKVYKYLPWTGEEFLMFDFSLQLTDNIVLENGYNYVVDAVDSVNVSNGGKRRRLLLIHYVGGVPFFSETWIEGVGHTAMPLTPFYHMPSDPDYQLTCSYQNGSPVYNRGIANNTTPTVCPEQPTAVADRTMRMDVFVFPNPSSGIVQLSIGTLPSGPATLRVHDVHGRLVFEQMLAGKPREQQRIMLDLTGQAPGVYHASVVSANERLSTRIVLQGH